MSVSGIVFLVGGGGGKAGGGILSWNLCPSRYWDRRIKVKIRFRRARSETLLSTCKVWLVRFFPLANW